VAALMRERALLVRNALAWRDVRFFVALFCAAQLLDGLTTYVGLASHQFQEENPLVGGLLDSHPLLAVVLKAGVAAMVVVALLAVRLRWRLRLTVIALFTAVSLVAPLVNLVSISRLA